MRRPQTVPQRPETPETRHCECGGQRQTRGRYPLLPPRGRPLPQLASGDSLEIRARDSAQIHAYNRPGWRISPQSPQAIGPGFRGQAEDSTIEGLSFSGAWQCNRRSRFPRTSSLFFFFLYLRIAFQLHRHGFRSHLPFSPQSVSLRLHLLFICLSIHSWPFRTRSLPSTCSSSHPSHLSDTPARCYITNAPLQG